jgi:hypothetical protein
MNIAPIATNMAASTGPTSASIVFVNHAYAAQAHQSAVMIKSAWPRPSQVECFVSRVSPA